MKKTLFFVFSLIVMIAGVAPAQTPTAEEILKLIRDVRLPQDNLSSLAFDMRMNLPMPLNILCQVRYHAPDHYSLHVFDDHDQTPVLIIIDHQALINDPLAESLTLIASAGVAFDFVPRGEEYNAQFAFNMPTDGAINNRVELDFKSMFARVSENVSVENASDGEVIFSGQTSKKNRCIAVLAPSEKFALRQTRLYLEGEPIAILEVTDIRVDTASEAAVTLFPMTELDVSGDKYSQIEPQGMIDTALVAASVLRAVFARSAIRNQELREKIEEMIGQRADWSAIEAVDAVRSEKLRRIFKPL
ncbi:MAG: hypothetical protein CVV42_03950 [Candidatus Riflebacteria bacterium HGW-Riflebacteria-2]|jgi:hypothetical protein|nr:MAG: hypothetical protein CVV42_03950 [Candidatus Riflebacteria bacterium HGW-Riflebacteria-2]